MIRAFLLSLAQLGDRRILGVLAQSLTVTLAIFAALSAATWWLLHRAIAAWTDWHSGEIAAVASVIVTALALWLLFRAISVAVIGVFADGVVAAVEARHYPAMLASARPPGLGRSVRMGAGSAARVLLVNGAMLPVYIVLLVTRVGTALAFFLVNGWLLGRDLGDMVASRHLDPAMMRGWRAATTGRRFLMGLAGTGLFVVPGLNLVAPVLGAAMATHLYHGSRR